MKIGYACISLVCSKKGISTSRKPIINSVKTKGIEILIEAANKNLDDMLEILKYNESIGIRFYRMSSEVFPHIENPKISEYDPRGTYKLELFAARLKKIGKYARENGHRVTAHPGQFAQLGTDKPNVLKQTIKDLTHQANIFKLMGLTPELGSVMIIHGGGTFKDQSKTIARINETLGAMDATVRQYIALENDEFSYSVLDLLPICEAQKVPLCIDFFHHSIKHFELFDIFDPVLLSRIFAIWNSRGIKPKCHWSNQDPEKRPGAHSRMIKDIPANLLRVCIANNVDVMLEAKDKDLCALQVLGAQFNQTIENGRVDWNPK